MDFVSILVWIVLGGIAGILASFIVGENNTLLMDIVWGIVGAIIGGALFSFFGGNGVTGLNLYSIVVATVGAAIVLYVVKAVNGRNRDIYKG